MAVSKWLHRVISNLPEPRDLFRRTLTQCVASNPNSTSRIVLLITLYLDVGLFSRDVIARIESMIAALEPAAEPPARIERQAWYEATDVRTTTGGRNAVRDWPCDGDVAREGSRLVGILTGSSEQSGTPA